jgi:hypothetical protein
MFGQVLDFVLEPLGAFARLFIYRMFARKKTYKELMNHDLGFFKQSTYYNLIVGIVMFVLIIYVTIKIFNEI